VEDENDQPERCRPVPSKNSIQAVLEVVLDVAFAFIVLGMIAVALGVWILFLMPPRPR
jgi:hypothetical protein